MILFILYSAALLRVLLFSPTVMPDELIGQNVPVVGVVASTPKIHRHSVHFQFETRLDHQSVILVLSWFSHNRAKPLPTLRLGQKWAMTVRLKPVHGTKNPGGFNMDNWAKANHIYARGYVSPKIPPRLIDQSQGGVRAQLADRIPDYPNADIIKALTLGFSSLLTPEHRTVFQRTGTSHLMAISGLHIGLVAGLMYILVSALTRTFPHALRYVPKQHIAAAISVLAALSYATLAGFSYSTQRSLFMLIIAIVCMGRRSAMFSLFASLALIIVLDPASIYGASIWLSFSAVFLLIYSMSARPHNQSLWWRWGRAQWVCSVGLLPLTVWYFQMLSYSSFVANLVAIPIVSFVVVPLCLLGLAVPPLLWLADQIITLLMCFLSYVSLSGIAVLSSPWQLFCASLSVLLCFAPKGLKIRRFAIWMILPIVFPRVLMIEPGHFQLVTLDVGQGLATLLRTHQHNLMFDSGPAFDTFDTGKAIIVPYCRHQRIRKLDVAVISHGDNDHAGGLDGVVESIPVGRIYTSELNRIHHAATLCDQHIHWQWDGVRFEFLNDAQAHFRKDNNNSCVLKVSGLGGSVLLAGDIERRAEKALLACGDKLHSTVMVVPHHGSKTSSSQVWLNAVRPKVAIFSYGYLNRFHHPSADVVRRYQAIGAVIRSTVREGAIEMMI